MSQLSEEQFAAQFGDAYTRLWTVAAAVLGNSSLADDVVQDAAITGLKRIADYQVGTNFSAWMSQIVRFTALNYRKKRATVNIEEPQLHLIEEQGSGQNQADATNLLESGQLTSDQRLFDDETAQALNELDSDRRSCLLLRIVHDLPYEDIAEIVGVPVGTAMSHVHRAKSSIRKHLDTSQRKEESHGQS